MWLVGLGILMVLSGLGRMLYHEQEARKLAEQWLADMRHFHWKVS